MVHYGLSGRDFDSLDFRGWQAVERAMEERDKNDLALLRLLDVHFGHLRHAFFCANTSKERARMADVRDFFILREEDDGGGSRVLDSESEQAYLNFKLRGRELLRKAGIL